MRSVYSLLAAMLALGVSPVYAAPPSTSVIEVPLTAVTTKNLALIRGRHVRVQGDIPDDLGAYRIVIEVGRQIVADKPNTLRHRAYEWDSTDFTAKSTLVRVLAAKGVSRPVPIATLYVDLYDKPPFSLTAAAPTSADPTHVVVTLHADGAAPGKLVILVDGKETQADFSGLTGKFSIDGMPTGEHQVSARVFLNDASMDLEALTIALPSHIAVKAEETAVTRSEPFHVIATPEPGLKVTSIRFLLDGQPLGSTEHKPYDLTLDLSSASYGHHVVYADAVDDSGHHYLSPEIPIMVKGENASPGAPAPSVSSAPAVFPRDLEGWASAYRDKMQALDGNISLLHEACRGSRYIGFKSLSDQEAICKQIEAIYGPARYSTAKANLPLTTAENRRTLSLALSQLSDAYQHVVDAIRTIRSAQGILHGYDGTVTNLPNGPSGQVSRLFSDATNLLRFASGSSRQGWSNVQLVMTRSAQ